MGRKNTLSGNLLPLALAALALSLAAGEARGAVRAVPLFTIERSKNANVVQYDAQLDGPGHLYAKKPVVVYWILKAHDGRREELNWVERARAYGFEVEPGKDGCWRMTLAAYEKREIGVCPEGDGARALVTIDGRPAVFEKLYIKSTEGLIKPTVHYLELFGKDLETGEPRYEKILP